MRFMTEGDLLCWQSIWDALLLRFDGCFANVMDDPLATDFCLIDFAEVIHNNECALYAKTPQ